MGTLSPSSLLGGLSGLNAEAAKKIYKPLQTKEIRVVKLHPADDLRNDLHCSLETVKLSQKPQYEALSYVWGNQTNPKTIVLDGHDFKVTQNLNDALRHLSHSDSERPLWVDALTINQSDTLERNSQVSQMATIYSSAAKTIVWLGTGDHIVEKLFSFVGGWPLDWVNFKSCTLEVNNGHGVRGILQLMVPFRAVGSLPYWSRAWVVQEGKFSTKTELVYGFQCLHSLALQAFLFLCEKCFRETVFNTSKRSPGKLLAGVNLDEHTQTCSELKIHLDFIQDSKLITLSQWIQFFCERQCEDPRDKVFSFYDCFVPRIRNSITVDYSKSTSEVFANIARAFIDYAGHLGILHITDLYERGASAPKRLPSWCPDFQRRPPFISFIGKFKVLDIEQTQPALFYGFDSGGNRLHLRGSRLSLVENIRALRILVSGEHGTGQTVQ
jgi:hypothetical protein